MHKAKQRRLSKREGMKLGGTCSAASEFICLLVSFTCLSCLISWVTCFPALLSCLSHASFLVAALEATHTNAVLMTIVP